MALSAIGPFATEHHIDFATLSASGLFLLEGPTGSGKSTIIDAIVFALYGKVASSATSDDRIRSAYADDTDDSYVDLVFETTHGIFRVTRHPERMRRKKRGTGFIKEQAHVKLWRLSTTDLETYINTCRTAPTAHATLHLTVGELRSQRMDETGAEITRIIGLDRHQFVQTIVLPQGEFANFLRAQPEDRRQLLQKVFGTELYEKTQEQLAAMKRDAERDVASSLQKRREAVLAFHQAAGTQHDDIDALIAGDDHELYDHVRSELKRTRDNAEDAETHRIILAGAERSAHTLYEQHNTTQQRIEQRNQLRIHSAELNEQVPDIQRKQVALKAAQRATYVSSVLEAAQEARQHAHHALTEFLSAVEDAQEYADLPHVDGDLPLQDPFATPAQRSTVSLFERTFTDNKNVLVTQRDAAQQQQGQLVELVRVEQNIPQQEKTRDNDARAAQQAADTYARLESLVVDRPARRAKLDKKHREQQKQAANEELYATAVAHAEDNIERWDLFSQAESEANTSQEHVSACVAVAQHAADHEHAQRQAWLTHIAGDLAQELEPDQPCMVCGSTTHPAPAQRDENATTQENVAEAETQRKAAERDLAEAQSQLAAAQERVAGLRKHITGANREEAQTRLDEAQAALTAAREAQTLAHDVEQQLKDFDAETSDLETQKSVAAQEEATCAARADEQTRVIDEQKKRIHDVVHEFNPTTTTTSSVEELQHLLHVRAQKLSTLIEAIEERARANHTVTTRESEVQRTLTEHGFTDEQEARNAELPQHERETLEHNIVAFEQRRVTLHTQLNDPVLVDLPEALDVNVAELHEAWQTAQARHTDAQNTVHELALVHDNTNKRAEALEEILKTVAKTYAAVAPVLRMAGVVNGNSSDNTKRLTLATFVLMRRFEDVVSAANSRLVMMSDGRYELERSDEKEDVRSRKTGLALRVIDHNTETSRDPRTLSGGETFYVSLCLALGLADVVTAEAGGIELGTLFVDEGFGSLDPHTLDAVVQVLGSLRDGGRTIGVVSHVETLKQTIHDRISVSQLSQRGSTLTVLA